MILRSVDGKGKIVQLVQCDPAPIGHLNFARAAFLSAGSQRHAA